MHYCFAERHGCHDVLKTKAERKQCSDFKDATLFARGPSLLMSEIVCFSLIFLRKLSRRQSPWDNVLMYSMPSSCLKIQASV